MTRRPAPTSAAPNPASIFLQPTSSATTAMSGTTAGPTPTPLPVHPGGGSEDDARADQQPAAAEDDEDDAAAAAEGAAFKLPKLRLNILDLNHPGASRFLAAVNASSLLARSVRTVLRLLYGDPSARGIPGTRSVTLYLEAMDGVAYTTGSDLDADHKEVHFSLGYIRGVRRAPEGSPGDVTGAYEIEGVVVHELVHCFQHDGRGTCPGGLVEGIADWVRLRANLAAPHWKRDALPERWDQGYEKTAYFLEWLEQQFGEGTVRKINETLRTESYHKKHFWTGLFGSDVETLWQDYKKALKKN